MTTTTWTTEQASELAAFLYNTATMDTVTTALRDNMTFQSHMDLSGWLLSRVVRHHNSPPRRAEVKVRYNHGQYIGQGPMGRYVITDPGGQPLAGANSLHEALVAALQALVQTELIEWPARWPYAIQEDFDRL